MLGELEAADGALAVRAPVAPAVGWLPSAADTAVWPPPAWYRSVIPAGGVKAVDEPLPKKAISPSLDAVVVTEGAVTLVPLPPTPPETSMGLVGETPARETIPPEASIEPLKVQTYEAGSEPPANL